MLVMGVECHGVAVLRAELLASEGLRRCQYRLGRGRRRHRERDVVHQLDPGRARPRSLRLPVLSGRQLEMPPPQ